ncbi:MAG: MFS transporter [Rhodospirillaceae bacterium]|nr:MFS transporter [Rhodospirillaceae bacterium]|tara:strand:+ start:11082 stop:12317 length:1236 start_codon:yes stop_codon:yes gene_type:complete
MAQLSQTHIGETLGGEIKILGLIGTGHFMSHFYYLTLPLLIAFLAADFGFSPAQLGFFIATFAIAAAAAQLPVGVLVDAIGARALLVGGLSLEAFSIGGMAFANSYPVLITLAVTAGLGHSVFHPADYAIMNSSIEESRIGRAFSIHTVSGTAGSALAPILIAYLAALWHWKLALITVAAFGLLTAVAVASQAHILQDHVSAKKPSKNLKRRPIRSAKANLRILMTPSVLILFAFFLITTMATSGIQSFAIFTLAELHNVSNTNASSALTAFLLASAVGVIAGGWVADKTPRHDLVASVAFLVTAAALILIGEVKLPVILLIALFAGIGILQGLVKPARDMMVRSAMPPGTAGTIFAFMSTGRLIGSALTPIIVGLLIANGMTDKVFALLAVFSVVGLATLLMPRKSVTPS